MGYDGTLKFNTSIDAKGFQDGIKSIGSIAAKGMKATAAIFSGAATGLSTLGMAAIKVGSDFEGAMSKVEAISGATGSDLEALTDKAKKMGASTKFSATESANAFEYMAMAGWKTEDMLEGIEGIMNLAAASEEDLATTSDIVTDALTAFGMSASESGRFADVMAVAATNANTNVGMMGETFKYVAPVAGSLGYSIEDSALAIGLMANSSIKASQAGTSLRSIITRLATNAGASSKSMGALDVLTEALGVSFYDTEGNARDLNDVLMEAREAWKGLGDEEATYYAKKIAGEEAISGWLAIMNASTADVDKLTSALENADGAAEKMAETMVDNLQGQLTILKSGLEGLGISFYESIQTPLKNIAVEAQEMVQQLQTAFDEGGLSGIVTAFGDVLAQVVERIAGAAPDLIDTAVGLVDSFCESLKDSPRVGDAAANLITSLATGLLSSAGTIWSTAIVLIGKMAGGIAAGAPQMVQAATTALADMVDAIDKWAPFVLTAGIDFIAALASGIANALPTLISQVSFIIVDIASVLVDNLPVLVDAALQLVTGLVQGLVEGIPILLEGAIHVFMAIVEALPTIIDKLLQALPDLIATVIDFFTQNIPVIIEGAIQLFTAILEALPVIIEKLLQALPDLITTIVDFFVQNIPLIVDGAIQLLMGIIEAIPEIIQAIADNLPQIITAIIEGLVNALPQVLEAAITLLMAITEAIPDIVVAIAENLPQIVMAINTGLADAIPAIFEAAKDLLWQIIEAFPEIQKDIVETMPDIIAGIVEGLIGGVTAVREAAIEMGSGILEGIKSFFGIHSPSTVMEEQGDYLVQGMINGLVELPDRAMEAISGVLDNIIAWGTEIAVQGVGIATKFNTGIITAISELPGKVQTWLVNVISGVIQWGINLKNTASTWTNNTINVVVNLFAQLPGKIQTWLLDVINRVVQWGVNLLSRASTAALNTVNKVTECFSQLPGKIQTWLQNTIAKVIQFGADLASMASTAAQGFVSNIVNGLSGLPDQMVTIGSNVVEGIWSGISAGWDWLIGKVKDLAGSLFQGAKDALEINSPSKVFAREVGQWIPPGIGVGVDEAMPDLEDQMGADMDRLARKMQAAVEVETGNITVKTRSKAKHTADMEYPAGGGDTYVDQHIEQENNYNVPVATPSEVRKAEREAARKLLGGVK